MLQKDLKYLSARQQAGDQLIIVYIKLMYFI